MGNTVSWRPFGHHAMVIGNFFGQDVWGPPGITQILLVTLWARSWMVETLWASLNSDWSSFRQNFGDSPGITLCWLVSLWARFLDTVQGITSWRPLGYDSVVICHHLGKIFITLETFWTSYNVGNPLAKLCLWQKSSITHGPSSCVHRLGSLALRGFNMHCFVTKTSSCNRAFCKIYSLRFYVLIHTIKINIS